MHVFLRLFYELRKLHGNSISDAIQLDTEVHRNFPNGLANATLDTIWQVAWDKPLFSNIRVRQANAWREVILNAYDAAGDGAPPLELLAGRTAGNFRVERFGRREFQVLGEGCDVPVQRLYSIQAIAQFLFIRTCDEAPFASVATLPFPKLLYWVQEAFGYGWGPITACHFLADCGVAVKPDLHLVRSINYFFGETFPKNPSVPDIVRIKALCDGLVSAIPDGYPQTLRFLDKVLMEISRQGLLDNANNL